MSRDLKYIVSAEDKSDPGWSSFKRRGNQAFDDLDRRAEGSADSIGTSMATAIGGALTVAGLTMFVQGLVSSIDALNDAADATGSTIEKMSELDNFARQTGASLQEVTGLILTMEKALSKAGDEEDKGVGKALKAI